MLHRLIITALVAVTFVLVADANGQLLGRRRADTRDLKAMEEYYDELEDYYEDRNPRLAREAERMEKYYEDLRKGRANEAPIVSLPVLRSLVPARLRQPAYQERSVLVPAPADTAEQVAPAATGEPTTAPNNGRWQTWGGDAPPATPSPEGVSPEGAPAGEPTLAPAPTEAFRVPTDAPEPASELRFPEGGALDPQGQLKQSHAALVQSLEQLAEKSPAAVAQWMGYLALPRPAGESMGMAEYFTTSTGRQQLVETLERYNSVAANPQFAAISRLESFDQTRVAIEGMLNWLEQQPTLAEPGQSVAGQADGAEELPVPPAG
jgi:hypothetical protein